MKPVVQGYLWGMHRRRRGWILLISVAVVSLIWWHQREPRYAGRPFSDWLDTYDTILSGRLTEPGFQETRVALRHFGESSLRFYTARLAYEPGWQLSVLGALGKAPEWLGWLRRPVSTYWREAIEARKRRAQTAVLAFQLLGEDAAPAANDLARLAISAAYPGRAQRAIQALRYLGPKGTTGLAYVAINGDPGASAEALKFIGRMGSNELSTLPLLANAFGTNFVSDPQKFYQDLILKMENCAQYSNGPVRLHSMRSLAVCRPESLFKLMEHRSVAVRADATNAFLWAGFGEWLDTPRPPPLRYRK